MPTDAELIQEHQHCRTCPGKLQSIIDLGRIYPSEFVEGETHQSPQPLVLCTCDRCGLVQLKHTIQPDCVYRQYWYRSSLNPAMVVALQEIVDGIEKRASISNRDVVVDIGANDGTLLSLYSNQPVKVGFDPALNLAPLAEKHCSIFVNDYFDFDKYPLQQRARAVSSIAMFYDLEDPLRFIADVKKILARDGIWVIQLTDLMSMLKTNAFDNLCMEHLEYYSLRVLTALLSKHELEIFDLEFNQVNGGSTRCYVGHRSAHPIQKLVQEALQAEEEYFNSFTDPFLSFYDRIQAIRELLTTFVKAEAAAGKTIFVLGASTKGNTLLQYFKLGHPLLQCAAEINPEKLGKKTVGTNIPIISEAEAFAAHPDYFLVLPWHFIKGFVQAHQSYLDKGGAFIVPMPEPAVIDRNGWRNV